MNLGKKSKEKQTTKYSASICKGTKEAAFILHENSKKWQNVKKRACSWGQYEKIIKEAVGLQEPPYDLKKIGRVWGQIFKKIAPTNEWYWC